MSNMRLRGTTRLVFLEENERCHHPSPLGDDGMLSPNYEMPSVVKTGSGCWLLCFLILGECFKLKNVMF